MRVRRPDIPRGFTVPALPVVAILGIVVCGAMIYGLGWTNWLRLVGWLVIGLVIYFGYGVQQAQPARSAGSVRLGPRVSARRLDGAGRGRGDSRRARAARSPRSAQRAGRPPALHIVLVGDDPASQVYVRNKERAGARPGSTVTVHRLAATASGVGRCSRSCERLNRDAGCDGILVQSPLPAALGKGAAQQVFDAIDPAKDVDGFHPQNVGLLVQGRATLAPCTPSGVIELLDARRHPDRRPARRRHRPQRDRRQADGAAAAAARRDGDDLSLEDRGSARRWRAEADILVAAIGRPGFVTRDVRQAGRGRRRCRHQRRSTTAQRVVGAVRRGQRARRRLRQEGHRPSSATCIPPWRRRRRADARARRRRSADDRDAAEEHARARP